MNDFQSNRPFTPSNSLYPYRYAALPQSLMPDDFLTLWGVVDDDTAPFKICVHRGLDVADLKKAIKLEKAQALRDFDASDLVLYMVSI